MKQLDIARLLVAPGPFAEYSAKLMLYGQFVGSWDIDATYYEQAGARSQSVGEWHFAWILGGRGIQDVLFGSGEPSHQFGTSLRCYDPALDAWHIAYMQPSVGEFFQMLGRKAGDRIVQEGVGSDHHRLDRWIFTDITPKSFLWREEMSLDDGVTWFLEQEIRARRRKST
jgi:hypothetical protein